MLDYFTAVNELESQTGAWHIVDCS